MPRKKKTQFCIWMTSYFCFTIILFSYLWMTSRASALPVPSYSSSSSDYFYQDFREIHKRKYGEICRKEYECDTDKFLICENQLCLCINQENSEIVNGVCTVLAGEDCSGNPICTRDAFCNRQKICECDSITGFERALNGSCFLAYQARCDPAASCNPYKKLVCDEETGLCDCPKFPKSYRWSTRRGKCIPPESPKEEKIQEKSQFIRNNNDGLLHQSVYTRTTLFSFMAYILVLFNRLLIN